MKRLPQRNAVAASPLFLCALLFTSVVARADAPWPQASATQSASGQFIVSETPEPFPFYRRPVAPTNTVLLRLKAPWVAVSAERFKAALWRETGLTANSSWRGKIYINLQPVRSTNDMAVIQPQPFIRVWNYRVELPGLISRNRYARTMSAVLLLEIANRNTPVTSRPAEIPAWLVDGLARQVSEADEAQAILSAPNKSVESVAVTGSGPTMIPGGVAQSRMSQNHHGLDPLAAARRVLQASPALTFDQLSWPGDAQMNGADGGVYLASAQLFVNSLLNLKNGGQKIRALLAALPGCENWQSVFFTAFRDDFRNPLDVEKWWSLRVVAFAVHSPGPQWTPAVSRAKLAATLSVPVEVRHAPDELPERTEISLQAAIRNFDPAQQMDVLRIRLRDLELVQLRLTPALARVADGYRNVLAEYLGEPDGKAAARKPAKLKVIRHSPSSVADTVKKLDALDAQRREIEAELERKTLPVPAF